MYRSRKQHKNYRPDTLKKSLQTGLEACPFCNYGDREVIYSTELFNVFNNNFAYQFWEFMTVIDHLMIVPKRHVESISELNNKERLDMMEIIGRYESNGYNVYAREKNSSMKSVPHQHTHLIKTDNRRARVAFFLKKPYILVKK